MNTKTAGQWLDEQKTNAECRIEETIDSNRRDMGGMMAGIPGDGRYFDKITVRYHSSRPSNNEKDFVSIEISSNGAVGGMDCQVAAGPNSTTSGRRTWRTGPNPKPKEVLDLIKRAMQADDSFLFTRYGKPTKNFGWGNYPDRVYGLSLARVKSELEAQRS